MHKLIFFLVLAITPQATHSTVFEPVKENRQFSNDKAFTRSFAAFAQTNVIAKPFCQAVDKDEVEVKLQWSLHYIHCAKMAYMEEAMMSNTDSTDGCKWLGIPNDFLASDEVVYAKCPKAGGPVHLTSEIASKMTSYADCKNDSKAGVHHHINSTSNEALAATWKSGVYIFVMTGVAKTDAKWKVNLTFEVKTPNGDHLSATNWPLLPFWGCMCAFYAVLAMVWLALCSWYWRDLLRLQMWIGAVILLGMVESAVFLGEIDSINKSGVQNIHTNIAGEIVSAFKRALARMLVVIVSLGYGIVRPQLGPALPRIVILGVCFFVTASIYGVVNVLNLQFQKVILYASIPVSIVDAVAAWWIFSGLVETTRLLRIRRNVIKLSLYKHFINTLALCLLAAVAFMVWSIRLKLFEDCPEWSWWWLEEGYWPMLFSIILLVICVLWRPSQNNQRYAFSPLRDCDDDDEENNLVVTELYDHIKPRSVERQKLLPGQQPSSDAEDDLKWVEENIPSSLTDALADNEEDRRVAKFELSKMQ